VISIDPAVVARWRTEGAPNELCLEVADPPAAWSALLDVFDEVPTTPVANAWSEAVVTPRGLLFRGSSDRPDEALAALTTRLGERGLTGRLTVDGGPDEAGAEAFRAFAGAASWVMAWLVPLRVPGLNVSYRAPREWRVRRFRPGQVDRVLEVLTDLRPAGKALVSWSGGAFDVPAADLPAHVGHWLEHGATTASLLGDPADPADPADPVDLAAAAPVVVTSVVRGSELLGVGRAGTGLVDDTAAATALLDRLAAALVELADGLAYAVVGVHETGRCAAVGEPFREAVPATARAQSGSLSLRALDQWVLDAAPVQILSPHHQVGEAQGLELEALEGDRRLLRIGRPDDWFSGPTRRAHVRNLGRAALAGCLPPARTPMPAPLL
jgi:hypothetical protein